MDPSEIFKVLGSYGFPTVAAIVLWRVYEARTTRSEDACHKAQEALQAKLDRLEEYVRGELTDVVSACTDVLGDVRDLLSKPK